MDTLKYCSLESFINLHKVFTKMLFVKFVYRVCTCVELVEKNNKLQSERMKGFTDGLTIVETQQTRT